MENQKIDSFGIMGIAIRTTNENGKSSTDIPALWQRFMSEDIREKIGGKLDDALYCVYTDYEKDHTRPYTTLLGCKVAGPSVIPEGMVFKIIAAGNYHRHIAKGSILQGVVFDAWKKIWAANERRAFTADFEVYGEKAADPENAEIDILVAIK